VTGVTPLTRLTEVSGVASDGAYHDVEGSTVMEFTVGGRRTSYTSSFPEFQAIRNLVDGHRPMRIWVSPQKEGLLSGERTGRLYQVSADGALLLRYADMAANLNQGAR
jgi:hypothetical protein